MYKKNRAGWLKHADFILLDIVVLQISFVIACFIRNGFYNPYENELYREMGTILVFIDVMCLFFLDTLKNVLKKGYYKELVSTVKNVIMVELVSIAYLFITKGADAYSRIIMVLTGGVYFVLSYVSRLVMKKIVRRNLPIMNQRSILVITSPDIAQKVVESLQKNTLDNINVSGVILTEGDAQQINGVPVVSTLEESALYVCRQWIDEVYIHVSNQSQLLNAVVEQLEETGVVIHFAISDITSKSGRKHIVEKLGSATVMTTTMNFFTPQQAFYKRMLDIIGGIVGCVITLLLLVVVGPLILISSPGPVFFKQERIGKNGKKFKMYKFRSMYMDAEERKKELMEKNRIDGGFMFKMKFDPRIIGNEILPDGTEKKGIGQFIRDTSIDEFPQFWNVLKGDMSLVGTRPPTVDEWNRYELHHRARMAIKPGITGMWQISGRSEITDFEQVVKLDTEYINNWSMATDIKILFKTVGAVLNKDGSM